MAAGKGTRMKSALPKVLHRLAGRSLLQHVLDTAARLGADRIVTITGHGAERVEQSVAAPGLVFVRQEPQLGTGHAVLQAVPQLHDEGVTLILNGDVPLIETATAQALLGAARGRPDDPDLRPRGRRRRRSGSAWRAASTRALGRSRVRRGA